MSNGLSIAAFAKRAGVSHTTVSVAVRNGRLTLLPDGGVDPKLLRTKWRAQDNPKPRAPKKPAAKKTPPPDSEPAINVDGSPKRKRGRPLKRPEDAKPSSSTEFAAITLQKERSLAALRQLEYEQRAGALVTVDAARRVLFEQARGARDHWLNWPARVAPFLAAELGVEPEAVLHTLTRLVHQHVSVMGEPDASVIRSSED
jgi:hypothetical protein